MFWALEALFVAEKSFVVNQSDKDIIEEDQISMFDMSNESWSLLQ